MPARAGVARTVFRDGGGAVRAVLSAALASVVVWGRLFVLVKFMRAPEVVGVSVVGAPHVAVPAVTAHRSVEGVTRDGPACLGGRGGGVALGARRPAEGGLRGEAG